MTVHTMTQLRMPRVSPGNPRLIRVLIGERYNTRGKVPSSSWETLLHREPASYLRIQLQCRAFSESQQWRLRERLGLGWEYSMNLLAPSIVVGQWHEGEAERASELFRLATQRWRHELGLEVLAYCCGARVMKAMTGTSGKNGEQVVVRMRLRCMRVPHPSGSCRTWNDIDEITRIRDDTRLL